MAGAQISLTAFYASSSTLFGIAIFLAIARTVIRIQHFHRLYPDDGFLFLAVAALIAGTGLIFVNIPYAHTQEQVEAGVQTPPPDFLESLVVDDRTQNAAVVLLLVAIFSIKFSFLFFFRLLLRQTQKKFTQWWWWTVFISLIPSTFVVMFSDFIACPYTGEAILSQCVTADAVARENATLKAMVALNTLTDGMVLSIPIMLLWKVHISLRKKLALGGIMCLSIFMIICSIVRISAANIVDGQVDTTWVLLWLELEACVAVIAVSVTAFRTLFTGKKPSSGGPTEQRPLKEKPTKRMRYEEGPPASELSYPSRVYQQMAMPNGRFESEQGPRDSQQTRMIARPQSGGSGGEMLPIEGPGIMVTHDIHQEATANRGGRPSHESFV